MKEVQKAFLAAYATGRIPARLGKWNGAFRFTGPGTGKKDYYTQVEWFLGSYEVALDYRKLREDANEVVFEIKARANNKSGWKSGTRLPASWTDRIREVTGFSIDHFVSDAPRGETMRARINYELAIINALLPSIAQIGPLPQDWDVPSFGGDWYQQFEMEGEWVCKKRER